MTHRNQFCPSTMRVLGIELRAIRPGNKGLYPLSNPASSVSGGYLCRKLPGTTWHHSPTAQHTYCYDGYDNEEWRFGQPRQRGTKKSQI